MIKKLKYWLKSKEILFADFKRFTLDYKDLNKRRIFIDRKSDVLFVAHIDAVQTPKYIRTRKTKSGKLKRIYAQGLDDRLGCMLAYELSNEFDADLLICDNEEKFQSTGQYHRLKDYNWIVEFDRAGNDVVTYNLDSPKFLTVLSEFWNVGIGACSDISELETTTCCMNIGIGYEFAHSKDSYVDVKTLNKQLDKFRTFYSLYADTKFEQELTDNFMECEICYGNYNVAETFGYLICEDCFNVMFNNYYIADMV